LSQSARAGYRPGVTDDDAADLPFSWVARPDGTVIISYRAAPVTALRGRAAERFLGRIGGSADTEAQELMARATSGSMPRPAR
jgi:hypothetical protein